MKINNLYFKYLISILYIVFLFPLFPIALQSSQIHVNVIILFFSLFPFLMLKKINLNGFHKWVLLYYIVCQLLLLPSAIGDISAGLFEISSIFSLFRPVLLYVSFYSLFLLLEKCDFEKIFPFISILIFISFLYMVFEVFFLNSVKEIVYLFYKREFRTNLTDVSTTFFGTSYYSGFVFYILYVISFARLEYKGNIISYLICFQAAVLVFISQSKTMILALLISTFFLLFLSSKRRSRISLYVFLGFTFIFVLNINIFFDSLSQFNISIIKQIKVLIFDTSQSDTLNARNSQISYAIDQVYRNSSLLGVGLTPSKSLETWLALFIYRYGFIGVINFSLLCMMICFYSFKIMKNCGLDQVYIGKSGLIFGLTLPLTQMSSAMIEFSKMGFLFSFFLALICVTYNKRHNI